ncbi:hypothetical protein F5Y14DRAFT_186291 [Nemania sp. NC0429]|nr:hypothetical protein F5Y14DRAFT_186291 [Nemania sp. NC0429]
MPVITDLPCELIALILRNLDHLRFLPPALVACRYFYTSFKQYRDIEAAILCRHITPALVPHSIAALEVYALPYPYDKGSVRDLLRGVHYFPSRLVARLPTMPRDRLRTLARTHDVVHGLATDFAASALASVARNPGSDLSSSSNSSDISLSPTEYYRFCRAFYRLDLFYRLCRDDFWGDVPDARDVLDTQIYIGCWILSMYSPWEIEQIISVHEFLTKRLSETGRDAFARHRGIEISELRTNPWAHQVERQWNELVQSQGVYFVNRALTAKSFLDLRSLDSAFNCHTSLPRFLESRKLEEVLRNDEDAAPNDEDAAPNDEDAAPNDEDAAPNDEDAAPNEDAASDDEDAARHIPEGLLLRLAHYYENDDAGNGPFQAWYHAGYPRVLPGSNLMSVNIGPRRCAYVFWDWERIEIDNLLPVFEDVEDVEDVEGVEDVEDVEGVEEISPYPSEDEESEEVSPYNSDDEETEE